MPLWRLMPGEGFRVHQDACSAFVLAFLPFSILYRLIYSWDRVLLQLWSIQVEGLHKL